MLHDGLQNIVANIGTDKDKASSHQWFVRQRSNVELEAIYRSGWMGRKIIDIPTSDMTRKWRQWTGEQSFIDKVSDVEKKFGIRQKITKAKRWARLYGSSAIIIGAAPNLGKPDEPLDVALMSVNDLKYLHVEIAPYLTIREWNTDITSERFGEPEFYYYQPLRHAGTMDPGSVSTLAHVRVHASRVIPFSGMPLPVFASFQGTYWGDSIFTSLEDTLNTAGSATSVIASLLMEAKTDVIKTDLSGIGTQEGEERIQRRFSLAMMLKSINNTVLMGNDEDWQQKTLNFAGLPDVHIRLMQEISGAARIPLTRFLGQTPTGLNNSGEGDLRNYYDDISQSQEDELRPQLERIDALLFASNGIQLPKDAGFTFTPLWQESEDQKATTQLKKAQATKIYLESGLIDTETLGRAVESQLVEDGVYPGLEAALKDEAGMDKEPEDVDEETSSSIKDYDPSQPRAPAGSENGGQWVSGGDLTEQQHVILKDYKEGGYRQINDFLRGAYVRETLVAPLKEDVSIIDDAIAQQSLHSDVSLYRGIHHEPLAINAEKLIGKTVEVASFQSTTVDKKVALEFAGVGKGAVIFKISVPKGTPAIDMSKFETSNNVNEKEILLGRGGRVRITGVDRTSRVPVVSGEWVAKSVTSDSIFDRSGFFTATDTLRSSRFVIRGDEAAEIFGV